MANKVIIAVDNGTSGSVAIIQEGEKAEWYPMPVKKCLNYTKEKAFLNRIDVPALTGILSDAMKRGDERIVLLERPMLNPTRLRASISAMRALEATLIVLEGLGLPYRYVDSKEWQKQMLPKNLKGSDQLKLASLEVGKRMWPDLKFKKDADSLLMAEWARLKNL